MVSKTAIRLSKDRKGFSGLVFQGKDKKKKLIDIGLVFRIRILKNLLDGFFRTSGLTDMHQSTSDTKLSLQAMPDNRKTDRFSFYGFY